MHTIKAAKTSAHPAVLSRNDRGLEERLLLERWAAADSARTMEYDEVDESLDRFDTASVAAYTHHGYYS